MISIKNATNKEIEIVHSHLIRRTLPKNALLTTKKAKGFSMFFLETGSLKVVSRSSDSDSTDQVLSVIKPGGFCGEEILLSDTSIYLSTTVALEESTVLELTKDNLQKIMTESMNAATKLLLTISKNYREAMSMKQEMGKLVAFVSPKDGVGRTTVAMNLAYLLAESGKKVIFIDCDLQLGDASLHLGTPASINIAKLIEHEDKLEYSIIEKYMLSKSSLKLLAAPELPQEADLISRSQLSKVIRECAKNADFVFLDVGCHIYDHSILLWDIADLLVFVVEGNLGCLTRLKRLLRAINKLNYPDEKFLGILNQAHKSKVEYYREYQKLLTVPWFSVREDRKLTEEAFFHGKAIVEQDPDSELVHDLEKILLKISGETMSNIEKGGIFSWIKSFFSS